VTVDARPEHIWPWLVQMGYQRGGLYSYDWLDRLFGFLDRPSANRVLPEFQHLAVGDTIRLVREPVHCSPCLLRECPIDHRCMRRVTTSRVLDEARGLLA